MRRTMADASRPGNVPETSAGRLPRRQTRGMTLVLCGADGCGKSTVSAAVLANLADVFNPNLARQFHWKPPVFSGRRQAARKAVTAPHAQPPRSRAASLLFFAAHWVEFSLGMLLRIRPITAKGGLVLIDRFYYDFFVDQRRYRLSVPLWLVRAGYWLLPKPELVFLLDAPPEVLQQRKREVPLAETARQCQTFRELIGRLPNGIIIDASQTPEKVAADIRATVLGFLSAKFHGNRRS